MNPEKLKRLKELILQFSYQKKEVTLASGRKSNFYFDGKQTTLHPEGSWLVGEAMYDLIREHFPQAQAVGGPTLGADPIATAVGMVSLRHPRPLWVFIVRKAPKGHGTMQWIEGSHHLRPGMRVVLVEDVITTGGSLLQAAERVSEADLVSLGAVVLVDREEGGKENLEEAGLKVLSLFKKSQLISP
jgi:orotate phosphoribosyltransferase